LIRKTAIGVCAATTFVLAVAPAQAATPSLSTVLSHTHAANVALTRAVAAFDAHALTRGSHRLKTNRNQIGLAVSQTAQLIQQASTPAERLAAAKAVVAVARHTTTDEMALAKVDRVLPKHSRLQRRVIHATAVDTARTTTAIDQLNALLSTLPTSGQQGVAKAIGHVTLEHGSAVRQLTADVTSHGVGATAKATAAADLGADIKGQHHAINLLQAIMPLLPAAGQQGVTTALTAIAASLDRQASRIAHARPDAPRKLRPLLTIAVKRAHHAAADATS
jgi:hypothetical protein